MTKLIEGYYKAIDSFYKILKSENGKFAASDATGNEYPIDIEYGDFGKLIQRFRKEAE